MRIRVAPPLEELRERRKEAANSVSAIELQAGFLFDGNRYQFEERTERAIALRLAAIAAGLPWPAGFAWRTTDDKLVPMTAEQFQQFAQAALDHQQKTLRANWTIKDRIAKSRRPESIDFKKR
jgi:hypothetical protein